ncbi:DUF6183 family protein [Kitasatospora sp. NPDC004531]
MTDRTARIAGLVAALPKSNSVSKVCALAEKRLGKGDAAFLADLGLAVSEHLDEADRVWQYRSVFDHSLRLLAITPAAENVRQALRLLAADRPTVHARVRLAASLLASGQHPEDLAQAFTGPASDELRACLVHELVLRGADLAALPGILAGASAPHLAHHPLGALPLTRSPLEILADLPSYSASGTVHTLPDASSAGEPLTVRRAGALPPAVETTTPEAAAELGRAFADWTEESNGEIEARVFEFAEPLPADAVGAALLALGLDCLAGTTAGTLAVSTCPPAEAWRVLFGAASCGGAYDEGVRGAYGRLAAWQSLTALADATPATAESRATACRWFTFAAPTSTWFAHIAWDRALAALTPDGRRLAVLAATDTD